MHGNDKGMEDKKYTNAIQVMKKHTVYVKKGTERKCLLRLCHKQTRRKRDHDRLFSKLIGSDFHELRCKSGRSDVIFGTTVLNGGVSMVVFFFVNKIIFPEGEQK